MPSVFKETMTAKQRRAWLMRYRYGWTMRTIALEMGISASGASKLLARAYEKTELPKYRVSVIRRKPRTIRAYQLSEVFEEY